ncbi:hypothetical protein EBR03_09565, partial [bacterium]|nr:hypothetical protein [bacterium]
FGIEWKLHFNRRTNRDSHKQSECICFKKCIYESKAVKMRFKTVLVFLIVSSIFLTGCSFDRDPGMGQNMAFDLQWFSDYDAIGVAAYTAFRQNPCIVLRYCGD